MDLIRSTNPHLKHKLPKDILNKINLVNKSLSVTWALRKAMLNFLPKQFNSYNMNSTQVKDEYVPVYKKSVDSYWDSDDMKIMDNFNEYDVDPIIKLINANPYAIYQDVDPLINCFDAERVCKKYGLRFTAYKMWCENYYEEHKWLSSVVPMMAKLFDPDYAVEMKKRYDAWKVK